MSGQESSERVRVRRPATLDDTDRSIVRELRRDGRLSMRALAEKLHISRAGVYARVERLQRDGVITGYAAVIDPERYGLGISAYVYLKISQHTEIGGYTWRAVRQLVLEVPEVWQGALVSGDYDLVLLVRTRDAAGLRDLVLNTFQTMPHVVSTQTVIILDELASNGPSEEASK